MVARYLTQQDVTDYGADLINMTQRAAAEAVAPQIESLAQQNAQLQHRLAIEARRNLDAAVERAIPNYRELDQNQDWHRWLLGIDNLSGRVRQNLLDEAKMSGDAARCIAFFRSFFARPQSAGGGGAAPSSAYGRTRTSASGPVYTAAQIAKLYDQKRRGAYVGREAEWDRLEVDFFRAQKEGRVIGGSMDLRGK